MVVTCMEAIAQRLKAVDTSLSVARFVARGEEAVWKASDRKQDRQDGESDQNYVSMEVCKNVTETEHWERLKPIFVDLCHELTGGDLPETLDGRKAGLVWEGREECAVFVVLFDAARSCTLHAWWVDGGRFQDMKFFMMNALWGITGDMRHFIPWILERRVAMDGETGWAEVMPDSVTENRVNNWVMFSAFAALVLDLPVYDIASHIERVRDTICIYPVQYDRQRYTSYVLQQKRERGVVWARATVCPLSTSAFAFQTLVETLEQKVFVGSTVAWQDKDLFRLASRATSWPGRHRCKLPPGAIKWLGDRPDKAKTFASALLMYMSTVVHNFVIDGENVTFTEPIEQISAGDPWKWKLKWPDAPCERVRVDVSEASGVCVVKEGLASSSDESSASSSGRSTPSSVAAVLERFASIVCNGSNW